MIVDDGTIRIVFRGVRGSYPVPGPATIRYGGNTSCQEIRVGGRLIIFDAGTGIIGLGGDLMKDDQPSDFALLFSHNHHDHTSGLLYFKPAYCPDTTMFIFGPSDGDGSIIDTLKDMSAPAAHPVPFSSMGMKYTAEVLQDGSVFRWSPGGDKPELVGPGAATKPDDVVVRVMKNRFHPLVGVLNFRLEYAGKSYVYATDVEGDEDMGDPFLAEFARGADLLSHDGQYTSDEYRRFRKGWGHSTIKMAVKTAKMARVKRLAIVHHEPAYSDDKLDAMETKAKTLFPDLFFAKEGQVVEV